MDDRVPPHSYEGIPLGVQHSFTYTLPLMWLSTCFVGPCGLILCRAGSLITLRPHFAL